MDSATISTWKHRVRIATRMVERRLYKILGRYNTRLQPHKLFSIKPGYHHATSVEIFDDTINKDEWQRSVYELSVTIAAKLPGASIIDIGCGSAWKLVHMLGQYNISGIEVEPTYSWLKNQYPQHKWLLFDETDPKTLRADLIICSDVIEHMADPDELLDFLEEIDFQYLVLSTPERNAKLGKNDYGPPENIAHYREWNQYEFKDYVRNWFHVVEQRILNDRSITQVLICKKKNKNEPKS
jgi:2-polyprenyl-3-methyl-5-hydroxy-6-metoxy-1,4-benzoquinol methylase